MKFLGAYSRWRKDIARLRSLFATEKQFDEAMEIYKTTPVSMETLTKLTLAGLSIKETRFYIHESARRGLDPYGLWEFVQEAKIKELEAES